MRERRDVAGYRRFWCGALGSRFCRLGRWILPEDGGGGDFLLLHHAQWSEAFAFGPEEVGDFFGHLDAHLIRFSGEGVGMKEIQDFAERKIDEAPVFGGGVYENTGGSTTAEFTKADFDGSMGKLFKHALT